jgi:hypothetical protein
MTRAQPQGWSRCPAELLLWQEPPPSCPHTLGPGTRRSQGWWRDLQRMWLRPVNKWGQRYQEHWLHPSLCLSQLWPQPALLLLPRPHFLCCLLQEKEKIGFLSKICKSLSGQWLQSFF